MNNLRLFLLGMAFAFVASLPLFSQPVSQVFEKWSTKEGSQNFLICSDMALDADNEVVGVTINGSNNYDVLVAKFSTIGEILWANQYNGTGNGHDVATALAIDGDDNVYVNGTTFTSSTDTLDVWDAEFDYADLHDAFVKLVASSGSVYLSGATYVGGLAQDRLVLELDSDDGSYKDDFVKGGGSIGFTLVHAMERRRVSSLSRSGCRGIRNS